MIIFLKTICCDPSSEPSRGDGSDEGSQHMFYAELTKLSLIIIKYSLISIALIKFCTLSPQKKH